MTEVGYSPRVTEEMVEGVIDCYEAMVAKAAKAGMKRLSDRNAWAKKATVALQTSPFGMKDERAGDH